MRTFNIYTLTTSELWTFLNRQWTGLQAVTKEASNL